MKICKYCATKTEGDAKKCPGCGAEEFYLISEDGSQSVRTNQKLSLFKILKHAPQKIRIAFVIGCILLLLLTGLTVYQILHPDDGPEHETEGLMLGFKNIGELATQAGYYTEIVSEKDYVTFFNTNLNVPGTKRHVIVSYNGLIKAGLDFQQISYERDDVAKIIKIWLPEVKVLSNSIDHDSMQVWYEHLNVFNPASMETSNELFVKLEKSGEQHSIENGLLDNALLNAKTIIENICKAQIPEYKVEYMEAD